MKKTVLLAITLAFVADIAMAANRNARPRNELPKTEKAKEKVAAAEQATSARMDSKAESKLRAKLNNIAQNQSTFKNVEGLINVIKDNISKESAINKIMDQLAKSENVEQAAKVFEVLEAMAKENNGSLNAKKKEEQALIIDFLVKNMELIKVSNLKYSEFLTDLAANISQGLGLDTVLAKYEITRKEMKECKG